MKAGDHLGPYELVSILGEGGMGVVWKALDTRLHRTVALKLISSSALDNVENRARLLREARAAASLHHPSVCTIFEIDETYPYLVMEFVEGGTLKERIGGRPLPYSEALAIATQVAEGLCAAHGKGIVHRDIKPANILLNLQGQAKITDFGLAQLTEQTFLTQHGQAMGTPAYMAPEQLRGESVGRRADIWAFGLVLHEMLTGRLPGPGSIDPLAPQVDRIILKCLRPDPSGRYQHMDDVLVDLRAAAASLSPRPKRRLLIPAAVLIVLAIAGGAAYLTRTAPPADPSIAVLPLANFSGDPGQDYLSDGLTDALITELARFPNLRVTARTSILGYKKAPKPLPDIGRELNVAYIVEGSVQQTAGRTRISARLLQASDGRPIWTDSLDRPAAEALSLPADVARRIAGKLGHSQATSSSPVSGPRNPAALDAFLRAKYLTAGGRTNKEYREGILLFERTLEMEPDFAAGHAALSLACIWYIFNRDPGAKSEMEPKAYVAIEKALALNPNLSEAYLARAMLAFTPANRFPFEPTIRDLRRAATLNPNSLDANYQLARLYFHAGLPEQGLLYAHKAIAIDPTSTMVKRETALLLMAMARYNEALETWERMQTPNSFDAAHQSWALLAAGRAAEAASVVSDAGARAKPNDEFIAAAQAIFLAASGKRKEAEERIKIVLAKEAYGHFHHASFMVACAYARLNEVENALHWLKYTAETGFPNVPLFESIPDLASVRSDPRYSALITRWKKHADSLRAIQ
ncbi:MAG: protein kinase [Acidobacteriia bacterium]|nr:protein kinase [Terriglobia bacterium]